MLTALDDLHAKYDELAASLGPALDAVRAAARLEEAARRGSPPSPARHARHEGIALAAREGLGLDELRLLVHLTGTGEDVVSRVERAGADLVRSVARILPLAPGAAEPIDLVETWTLSEGWNQRAPDPTGAHEAGLDRDAEALCRLLHAFAADPTPIEGADLVARICRENLFPRPDRIACLLAPGIMRLALGTPGARFGLARHLPPPDRLAALPPGEATRAVLLACRAGAIEALEDLEAARALRADLAYRIADERRSSRTPEAIDVLIATPVLSVGDLLDAVGLTHRGANMMLRRLVGAGVVRPHRTNRAKGRLFVCDRALRRPS